MLLEMLLHNKLEEAVCDGFCCLLAQSHIVRVFIVFSESLLRFTGLLCSSAFECVACLRVVIINAYGVLCSN